MNLETQIRQVRARLSEPSRTDPSDDRFGSLDVVDWIHHAEVQILRDLAERERFITTATVAAVSTQETYTSADSGFPTDMLDIVRVTYNGTECVRHPVHELGALDNNSFYRAEKGFAQFFYEISDVRGNTTVGIRPIPDDTANIVIHYVKYPTRRYKHQIGKTTTIGTTTTMVDTTLTEPNDYWNDSEVRLSSGILQGEERTVSDFVLSSNTVTVSSAFSAAPLAGVTFELGQVSDLPEDFGPVTVSWAAYLGFMAERDSNMSQISKAEYEGLMAKLNSRYGFSRAEPGKEGAGTL